jgi:hypothetical protein
MDRTTSGSTKRVGNLQLLKKPTAKGNSIQVLPPRKMGSELKYNFFQYVEHFMNRSRPLCTLQISADF